jgi:hypothetical protein
MRFSLEETRNAYIQPVHMHAAHTNKQLLHPYHILGTWSVLENE